MPGAEDVHLQLGAELGVLGADHGERERLLHLEAVVAAGRAAPSSSSRDGRLFARGGVDDLMSVAWML